MGVLLSMVVLSYRCKKTHLFECIDYISGECVSNEALLRA